MTEILQILVSGCVQGVIYALIAFGYNLTFSTSKTINFSLGNVLMLGGVVGFSLYVDRATGQLLGYPYLVPIIGVLVAGVIAGWVVHKFAVEPSLKLKSEYTWVLATLAMGIIIKNAVEQIWSTGDYRFPSPLGDDPIRIFGAGIYPQEILAVVVATAMVFGIEAFKRYTIYGKAIQAVSEDKETASLMGIPQQQVVKVSFMLSATIATVGGLLVAPWTFVSATMGTSLGTKAYVVAIIGGLESGFGLVVGGLILGISEFVTARYISSGYKELPGFIILILVILIKPSGLFGKKTIKKV
ncbi:branched-chain amino acid ABC transporter permease [Bdellovibrio sp. NC01]|uniref:branched-chain amino acid ABC transporter permease n=1 Tax=Bdellovibrio sp. NC01 TaxID=2220073 RepID=UPI0011599F4B|nr:branched-chain amino acid ABC transporter permease [Bdellovibrio sp. NC01]QDK37698.1 branched-chain amino acid ABC transporter permease [Bdellovibrio sp. NC01]